MRVAEPPVQLFFLPVTQLRARFLEMERGKVRGDLERESAASVWQRVTIAEISCDAELCVECSYESLTGASQYLR